MQSAGWRMQDLAPCGEEFIDWSMTRLVRLVLVASVTIVAGCGSDRLPTYDVTGTVVFPDGSALPGGWIVCESAEHGLAARGIIDTDGSYRLGTYAAADGAVAGRHLVAITPAPPAEYDPDRGGAAPLVDPRFMHMDTSGIEFEVQADAVNQFKLVVDRTVP